MSSTRHRDSLGSRLVAALALMGLAGCAPTPSRPADSTVGTWRLDVPMPQPRAAHAVVAGADAIFVLGGTGEGGRPVRELERFDGRAWSVESTLPGPGLNAPAAALIENRIYVIGGFQTDSNVPSARVLVYDLARRAWNEAAALPAPRGGHAAVVLDGRIHVVGGGNDRSTLADHDVYDPATDRWSTSVPLPRSEGSPAAVVRDGKIYAIGGRSGGSDFGDVFVYDPDRSAWVSGPSIEPRGTAGAVVQCDAIVVVGGESQQRRASLDEVLELDATGSWRPLPSMPEARNFARAARFGADVVVVGGSPTPEPSHASIGSATVQRFTRACRAR